MSACIIPVAPNFQDPPSVPDQGPYLAGYTPVDGKLVTYTPNVSTFSVVVTAPNVGDKLFFRWVWDYPPFNNSSSMIFYSANPEITIGAGPDGRPIGQTVTQNICCSLVNNANGLHQVEFIVADGQFEDSSMAGLTDDTKFDTLIDPAGHFQKATWTIVMSCMASTPSTACPQQ